VPRVSGSLPSHYAPQARVELVDEEAIVARARKLAATGQRVAVLHPGAGFAGVPNVRWIQTPPDPADLARSLYTLLRRIDELGCDVALMTLPQEEGLGIAIADRLRRAAGPRDFGAAHPG
jgi:L-threonylcarbamoyladenylate synthase